MRRLFRSLQNGRKQINVCLRRYKVTETTARLLPAAKRIEVKGQPGSDGVMLSARWKDKHTLWGRDHERTQERLIGWWRHGRRRIKTIQPPIKKCCSSTKWPPGFYSWLTWLFFEQKCFCQIWYFVPRHENRSLFFMLNVSVWLNTNHVHPLARRRTGNQEWQVALLSRSCTRAVNLVKMRPRKQIKSEWTLQKLTAECFHPANTCWIM